jgi:transcriptional regulator with XRE-family HTH domain
MDIGQRLRRLGEAKFLSQGDIEKRSGLSRRSVSKIANAGSAPMVQILEKWANAFEGELSQLLDKGHGQPAPRKDFTGIRGAHQKRLLLRLFAQMPEEDRRLLISLAGKMVMQNGKGG